VSPLSASPGPSRAETAGLALRSRGLDRYEDAHFVVETGPAQAVALQDRAPNQAFEAQILDGLFIAHPPSARGYALFARALAALPLPQQAESEQADGRVDTWA